jgi:Putative Ig domain
MHKLSWGGCWLSVLWLTLGILGTLLQGCASVPSGNHASPSEATLLVITTSSLPNGQINTAYSATLVATGGKAPLTWSLTSGTLPAGLSLNASTGAITGTPTVSVTSAPVTFEVQDSSSPQQTKTVSLTLTIASATLVITTSSLPNGQINTAYSATLVATGGKAPLTWSLTSGTLPTGLSLNASTGAITGTPTVSVTSAPVTFEVQDSSSPQQTKTVSLTLTIESGANASVSLTPIRGGATITQLIHLTAIVTNDVGNAGVTWAVSSGGALSSATTSVASFSASTAGVYTVTATSIANPGASATATFGVTDLAGVYTYHNNLSRDGSNPSEYALTPSNISTSTFGKLFSCTVDGAVYAQPLWVANVTINSVKRNVVFVATQHEGLYAFDADVNTTPCSPLWQVSLIDSAHGGSSAETSVPSGPSGNLVGGGTGDITPEVGITGTPVIDPSTNTLYVVSKSVIPAGPTFVQRLHAIDLTSGVERSKSPITITATFPGTGDGKSNDTFQPGPQNQRPGLALVNGIVYIAWASHEDHPPYYGWVIGYNASTLSQTAVLNVTPNVGFGGIWMGGGAPAADSNNNLYLITGNGTFDATNLTGPANDYGDSFLKLTPSLGVSSYFTPTDESSDNGGDKDFGAGGAAILVDQPSGPVQHLVIGGGKDGYLYLLDRDSMGGFGDSNARQRFNFGNGIFATGAFWNNTFYMAGANGHLQAFTFNTSTGKFNISNVSQSSTTFGFPGSTPSVSASGATNGIVWALDNANYCTKQSGACGPAVLHAYNSANLATEIWNSSEGSGNAGGNAVKFTVPTVANGKVYVGTRGNNSGGVYGSTSISGELDVYGLLPN